MFKIGDRVVGPHGPGTIVAYNGRPRNHYFHERTSEVLNEAKEHPILIPGLVESLYSSDRYPYVVQFDNGYKDVYSENSLTGTVDNGDGTASFKGKLTGMGL